MLTLIISTSIIIQLLSVLLIVYFILKYRKYVFEYHIFLAFIGSAFTLMTLRRVLSLYALVSKTQTPTQHDYFFELVGLGLSVLLLVGVYKIEAVIRMQLKSTMELRRHRKILSGVTQVTHLLLVEPQWDTVMTKALAVLGENVNVDRAYIFQNHLDPKTGELCMSQRYEWTRKGIKPQRANAALQNAPYSLLDPELLASLGEKRVYQIFTRQMTGNARQLIEGQDIISLLAVPIFVGEKFWGFIGFDDCTQERVWNESETSSLLLVADALGGGIQMKETLQSLNEDKRFLHEVQQIGQIGGWIANPRTDFLKWSEGVYSIMEVPLNTPLRFTECLKYFPERYHLYITESVMNCLDNGTPFNFDVEITCENKKAKWAEIRGVSPVIEGERSYVLGTLQDISETKKQVLDQYLQVERVEALLSLNKMIHSSLKEITDYVLEEGIRLTNSKIGYLAFLNEDETVLTMHSWSKESMSECMISDKPIEYRVDKTGLWGEAVRQRKPIITNNYSAPSPHKKGYPEGHVHLTRHMNVPIFEDNKIVALMGVGNKPEDYTQEDVYHVTLLLEAMWRLLENKEIHTKYLESQKMSQDIFENSRAANLLIDPYQGKIVEANKSACEFYGYSHEEMTALYVWDINTIPKSELQEILKTEAKNNSPTNYQVEQRLASGEIRKVLIYNVPVKLHDKMYIHVTVIDVTYLK